VSHILRSANNPQEYLNANHHHTYVSAPLYTLIRLP
jgi:hypothetical protein